MARSLFFGVVLALSFRSPVFAATELAIAMGSSCTATGAILEIAKKEAVRIWSRADVHVGWMTASDLPYTSGNDKWLVVQCVTSDSRLLQASRRDVIPIAAIRFLGAQPTNTMVVSLANANALLRRDLRESRELAERFLYLKELRLGRVIGRAIAHEIGHFLSASGAHTPGGLMRASHTVGNLIGDSLSPFKVDRGLALPQQVADSDERGSAEDVERSQLHDRDAFVPWIDPEPAHGWNPPKQPMERDANAVAAAAMNQVELRHVCEERVVQRALGAGERLFDGQPVQVHFGRESPWA